MTVTYRCRALGHEVTFDLEAGVWTGESEMLVETLNALTEPRHSPSDPAELRAVREALSLVDGEIVSIEGRVAHADDGMIR